MHRVAVTLRSATPKTTSMWGARRAPSPLSILRGALRSAPPRHGSSRDFRSSHVRTPNFWFPAGPEAEVPGIGTKEILEGACRGGRDVVGALQPKLAAHEEAGEGLQSHRHVRVVHSNTDEELWQQLT